MICKASLTISSGKPELETAATCELTFDGGDDAKFSEEQIRRLQNACLVAVRQQSGLAAQPKADRRESQTAAATLRQLAKLYRLANRLPAFDHTHLQNLSRRLYQKPLEELSMLEVADLTSTLNAVMRGIVDVKEVLKTPDPATNGHLGNRLA